VRSGRPDNWPRRFGAAERARAEAEAFVADCIGTTRWVGSSPFRPLHRRRNWFVGVQRISTGEEAPGLRDEDIRYQTLRAPGPGGQHVNKTDSAVPAESKMCNNPSARRAFPRRSAGRDER